MSDSNIEIGDWDLLLAHTGDYLDRARWSSAIYLQDVVISPREVRHLILHWGHQEQPERIYHTDFTQYELHEIVEEGHFSSFGDFKPKRVYYASIHQLLSVPTPRIRNNADRNLVVVNSYYPQEKGSLESLMQVPSMVDARNVYQVLLAYFGFSGFGVPRTLNAESFAMEGIGQLRVAGQQLVEGPPITSIELPMGKKEEEIAKIKIREHGDDLIPPEYQHGEPQQSRIGVTYLIPSNITMRTLEDPALSRTATRVKQLINEQSDKIRDAAIESAARKAARMSAARWGNPEDADWE